MDTGIEARGSNASSPSPALSNGPGYSGALRVPSSIDKVTREPGGAWDAGAPSSRELGFRLSSLGRFVRGAGKNRLRYTSTVGIQNRRISLRASKVVPGVFAEAVSWDRFGCMASLGFRRGHGPSVLSLDALRAQVPSVTGLALMGGRVPSAQSLSAMGEKVNSRGNLAGMGSKVPSTPSLAAMGALLPQATARERGGRPENKSVGLHGCFLAGQSVPISSVQ